MNSPHSPLSGMVARVNLCHTEIPSKNTNKMSDFGDFSRESL